MDVSEFVRTPNRHDVLLGRGGQVQDHAGNKELRSLVKRHVPDYALADKASKEGLVDEVCRSILSKGGRFLRKTAIEDPDGGPRMVVVWQTTDRRTGYNKVRLVFRDIVAEQRALQMTQAQDMFSSAAAGQSEPRRPVNAGSPEGQSGLRDKVHSGGPLPMNDGARHGLEIDTQDCLLRRSQQEIDQDSLLAERQFPWQQQTHQHQALSDDQESDIHLQALFGHQRAILSAQLQQPWAQAQPSSLLPTTNDFQSVSLVGQRAEATQQIPYSYTASQNPMHTNTPYQGSTGGPQGWPTNQCTTTGRAIEPFAPSYATPPSRPIDPRSIYEDQDCSIRPTQLRGEFESGLVGQVTEGGIGERSWRASLLSPAEIMAASLASPQTQSPMTEAISLPHNLSIEHQEQIPGKGQISSPETGFEMTNSHCLPEPRLPQMYRIQNDEMTAVKQLDNVAQVKRPSAKRMSSFDETSPQKRSRGL